MPTFNTLNPSLIELDDALAVLEAALQTFESSDWIVPGVGSGLGTVKWDPVATAYVTNLLAEGSAVAQTSGTAVNITSVALPPGKWEVSAFGVIKPVSGTPIVTHTSIGLHTATGTLPALDYVSTQYIGVAMAQYPGQAGAIRYFDFSAEVANKDVYLVGKSTWTGGGNVSAFGSIRARKIP